MPGLLIFRLDAPLLAFNARHFRRMLLEQVRTASPTPRVVVYDLEMSPGLNVESVDTLAKLNREFQFQGVLLSTTFEREGGTMPASGTLSLHVNGEKVGEGKFMTQPGNFSLAGEGLNVGQETGILVTGDYAGNRPYPFSGGRIVQVIIEVSGGVVPRFGEGSRGDDEPRMSSRIHDFIFPSDYGFAAWFCGEEICSHKMKRLN